MKTKYVLIFSLIFSCLAQNMEAQNYLKKWQWAKKEGGSQGDQNGDIDDQVLKILPAIENDGSFIVVSKLQESNYDSHETYFGDSVYMPSMMFTADNAIIVAKHDCDGNAEIVRVVCDHSGTVSSFGGEQFATMTALHDKYYFWGAVNNYYAANGLTRTAEVFDSIWTEKKTAFLAVLNKDLTIDTLRYSKSLLGNIAPIGEMTIGPDKNFYFITGVGYGIDSTTFFHDEPTQIYTGYSLVKMDTFGNVLETHQLTDSILSSAYDWFGILGFALNNEDKSITIAGGVNVDSFRLNGEMVYDIGFNNAYIYKMDSNYNTVWLKQPVQHHAFTSSSIREPQYYNEDSLIVLFEASPYRNGIGAGVFTFQGDTVISTYNTATLEFPVILDPHTGQKLNWDYPDGEIYYGIQDKIIENNKLFLNYSFYSINWKNIQINRIMGELYNGIFEYDITTGAIDTVTTYRFQDLGRPDRCATTSMAKIGDNFIVGGHYFTRMYFDSITLLQAGGPNTDMFLAKFGTGECVPCIPSQALFAYGVDTFALQAYSQAQQADSSYWQINGQYITTADSLNYSFADTGTYQICQIVQNHCSADTFCQNISIVCPAPQALFGITQNGQQISLQNNSMNSHQYQINWGDGQSNTDTTHLYSQKGNYTICMYVQNTCGTDTNCIDVEIATHIQQIAQTVFYWQVYPNPTQGDLHIVWQNIVAKEKTIRIQNIVGKDIAEQKIKGNNGKIKINTNEWTKGIYFINIESEGQNIARKKVLVF